MSESKSASESESKSASASESERELASMQVQKFVLGSLRGIPGKMPQ